MKNTKLIDLFQVSRNDKLLAIIEGVQALKHAVRFKAELLQVITCDINLLETLLDELAPDVKDSILSQAQSVDEETFARLSPQPPRTKVIAIARRAIYKISDIDSTQPIIFLEEPRDLENIGAVIRVSAAANAAAVCISGPVDVWQAAIIRGAAGLHYALPVISRCKIINLKKMNRKVVSLDPTGEAIDKTSVPSSAILVFGTERHGISQQTLSQSDQVLSLPMKPGVSSLNLATSVSATLYSLK